MKSRQFIIRVFLIGLVFFLFCFFRFYNLEKRIGFGWDQENLSYQVKKIIVDKKLTLIGQRVNNDQGFFLAPYLRYLIIPFYLLTNLHPYALIHFVVFFNFLFFWVCFYLVRKVFDKKIACFFLFFWSVNLLLIKYDTIPWEPITIPLGVIIVWYLLYKTYKKRSKSDYFVLGLTVGFFNNMHFQFIFIFLFSLIFLIFEQFYQKKISFKNFLFLILGYILPFTPLLIFDLRHNFLNTKAFFRFFFFSESNAEKDLYVWWEVFKNLLEPLFFYKNDVLLTKFFYFLVFFPLIFLIKKEKKFNKIFFLSSLLLWLIFPIFFTLYGKRPSEYYFIFIYPFIYLIILRIFTLIKKEYILVIFLLFFLAFNINIISNFFKDDDFGLYYKDQVVKKLKELTLDKKFNISFSTPLGQNHGFSYLIDWYQIKQSDNFKDPLVEIRIPPKEEDVRINEAIGIKIPKELK